MPATDFALKLELDPAKDNTWSQNETSFLYGATIRRGRAHALTPISPGTMELRLKNRDGRYSPDKGVIAGLDHFTPVRLYATWTQPNVINSDDNPSAEVDAVGATGVSATVARDTAESWVGGASFKTTTTNVDNSGVEKKRRDGGRFDVVAGLAYTWSCRLKGTSGKNMTVEMLWYNINQVNFQTDTAALTFGSGWVQSVLTITAPTGAVTLALRVLTDGAQGVFDFWLDASHLYQSATLRPYVDGDQPGCVWTDVAHQSTSSRPLNPKFLLFQGFVVDFDLGEDKLDQEARLSCVDRMALWPQINVSMGNLLKKTTGLILHRLLDRLEGELISNYGEEWTNNLAAHPNTNYSEASAGSNFGASEIANSGSEGDIFEGDWVARCGPSGGSALQGWRYDATTDIAATGMYRSAVYARSETGTVAVRFRVFRDAAVIATKTVTLTTSWQRIELDFNLSTLGTNRYIELVTDVASSVAFRSDDLHCVLKADAIKRDIDAGAATLELVNAYREPISTVIGDVVESEPGIIFVKAKKVGTGIGDGDVVAFRDRNSRPATAVPRVVFGDGDGLLGFADGLRYQLAAADRVASVTVTSRGTPSRGSSMVLGWELSPTRALAAGDFLLARYQQSLRKVRRALLTGAVDIKNMNMNFGAGFDIDVVTGAADGFLALEGFPYDYSAVWSSVTKRDGAALPVKNHLSVQMPLQGTNTADMSSEAQRLLDKYKNRVVRLALPLHQRSDEVQAFQLDADLNEMVVVRAKFEDHSPGFDKKFWVEGIQHEIDGRGGTIQTTLLLEEA